MRVLSLLMVTGLIVAGVWGWDAAGKQEASASASASAAAAASASARMDSAIETLKVQVEDAQAWMEAAEGADFGELPDAVDAGVQILGEPPGDAKLISDARDRIRIALSDAQASRIVADRQAQEEARREAEVEAAQRRAEVEAARREVEAAQRRADEAQKQAETPAPQSTTQAPAPPPAPQSTTQAPAPPPAPQSTTQAPVVSAVSKTVKCSGPATITVTGQGNLTVNGSPISNGGNAVGTSFYVQATGTSPLVQVAWASTQGTCTVN